MRTILRLLLIGLFCTTAALADPPDTLWTRTFGGSSSLLSRVPPATPSAACPRAASPSSQGGMPTVKVQAVSTNFVGSSRSKPYRPVA